MWIGILCNVFDYALEYIYIFPVVFKYENNYSKEYSVFEYYSNTNFRPNSGLREMGQLKKTA